MGVYKYLYTVSTSAFFHSLVSPLPVASQLVTHETFQLRTTKPKTDMILMKRQRAARVSCYNSAENAQLQKRYLKHGVS